MSDTQRWVGDDELIKYLQASLGLAKKLNGDLRVEMMLRDKEIARLREQIETLKRALAQAV